MSAMRPASPPTAKQAANPTRKLFDPWNSSATGHQRAENRLSGSTAWRDSRPRKLGAQFADDEKAGGARLADTVGAGSERFGKDGRNKNGGRVRGTIGLTDADQRSLWEFQGVKSRKPGIVPADITVKEKAEKNCSDSIVLPEQRLASTGSKSHMEECGGPSPKEKQIFRRLNFYINGSTYPLASDHKLKYLIVAHGGTLSMALGRRSVTHVILGDPSTSCGSGAGGGLAAGKMEKEIAACRAKGIKFVGAAWVLESIAAGKRLPEASFANLKLAPKGQRSVMDMFEKELGDAHGLDH